MSVPHGSQPPDTRSAAEISCNARGLGWNGTSCTNRATGQPVNGGRSRRAHKGRTLKAKTLRRMLKKKGMKTTGKKSTLMKRLHMRGGWSSANAASVGGDVGTAGPSPSGSTGGRRRSRRRRSRREE